MRRLLILGVLLCASAGASTHAFGVKSKLSFMGSSPSNFVSSGDMAPWQPIHLSRQNVPAKVLDQLDPFERNHIADVKLYTDHNYVSSELNVYEICEMKDCGYLNIYVIIAEAQNGKVDKGVLLKLRNVVLETKVRPTANHGSGNDATVYMEFSKNGRAMFIGFKQTGNFAIELPN